MIGVVQATEGKYVTGAGQVKATSGKLWGIITFGAAGAGRIEVRDGGAGGTVKFETTAVLSGTGYSTAFTLPVPIAFQTDIHVTYNGTAFPATLLIE